jgi:hypothetical protein
MVKISLLSGCKLVGVSVILRLSIVHLGVRIRSRSRDV